MNIYSHCPDCGNPSVQGQFYCGFRGLQGCINKQRSSVLAPYKATETWGSVPYSAPDPWASAFLNAQLKASTELEFLRKELRLQPGAIENLVNLYTDKINDLQEQLAYEKLKADAYRMVWSAREYIRTQGYTDSWASTHFILSRALNTLEVERVNGVAIREKYNPKVVKLQKRCSCPPGGRCSVCVTKDYFGPKC